jgi:hypothetical protein
MSAQSDVVARARALVALRAERDFSSSDSSGAPLPAPAIGRAKRAAPHAHSGSDGSSSSDGGHGVMRTELGDDSGADDYRIPAPSRRRHAEQSTRQYTHMTQSELDQARLVAMAADERRGTAPAEAAAVPAAPEPYECPVCCERFESLYNESRARNAANGRENKARSAVQQTIINRYAVIFSIETTLRSYLSDAQLLPMLLRIHQVTIEKPAREHQIKYQPWSLQILQRHFDPANPHIFDPVRELRINQHCARQAMLSMRAHLIEPDPNNPGMMAVNRTAVSSFNSLMAQNAKMISAISKHQSCADESVSNAVFALVSTVRRLGGNSEAADDDVLHNPTQAAGTMAVGGSATQAVTASSGALAEAASNMYKISGF